MNRTRNELTEDFLHDFVERYGDAWRSHDPTRITALCTEDVEWVVPDANEPLRGGRAVEEWLARLFTMLPDAEFDYPLGAPLLATDRSSAAARFGVRGRMLGPMSPPGFAPTNAPVVDEGIEVYEEFRSGRLHRCVVLFDRLNLAEQIGAAPAAGSLAERAGVAMQRLHARRSRQRNDPS